MGRELSLKFPWIDPSLCRALFRFAYPGECDHWFRIGLPPEAELAELVKSPRPSKCDALQLPRVTREWCPRLVNHDLTGYLLRLPQFPSLLRQR
jgi:hypothetical protein